jgi:hypothetical protein
MKRVDFGFIDFVDLTRPDGHLDRAIPGFIGIHVRIDKEPEGAGGESLSHGIIEASVEFNDGRGAHRWALGYGATVHDAVMYAVNNAMEFGK